MTYPRVDDRIVVLLGGNRKAQVVRICDRRRLTVSDFIRTLADVELDHSEHPAGSGRGISA
jgi:hypothetical protein